MPSHIGRILLLIQTLLGYGRHFAASLRQQTVPPRFHLTMQARFGTSGIARILIRLGRALRLAAALETQKRRPATTGPNAIASAERALVPPRPRGTRSTTTAVRRAAGSGTVPDNLDDDLHTDQAILALARRTKFGRVIAAIRRDLGLVPGVVIDQQWKAGTDFIRIFGGNFMQRIGDALARIDGFRLAESFTRSLATRRSIV